MNLQECTLCGERKPRIKETRKDGSAVHKDLTGALWKGWRCPECLAYEKHFKKIGKPKTKRKCRKCDVSLDARFYFFCMKCAPDADDCWGTEGWVGVHGRYLKQNVLNFKSSEIPLVGVFGGNKK